MPFDRILLRFLTCGRAAVRRGERPTSVSAANMQKMQKEREKSQVVVTGKEERVYQQSLNTESINNPSFNIFFNLVKCLACLGGVL